MKIGIYTGSFNPPHKGHIYVVNFLLEKNIVDNVLIIPTGNYWNKNNLVDLTHRINMLKLYENDKIKVDNKNNNYPWTYLLMRKLSDVYPNDNLYLIIGADNIKDFNKWKEYQDLLKYHIIIMNRDGINIQEYLKNYPNGHFIVLEDFHPIDISSTKLRNNIDSEYLDEPVKQYIKKHNLYK